MWEKMLKEEMEKLSKEDLIKLIELLFKGSTNFTEEVMQSLNEPLKIALGLFLVGSKKI